MLLVSGHAKRVDQGGGPKILNPGEGKIKREEEEEIFHFSQGGQTLDDTMIIFEIVRMLYVHAVWRWEIHYRTYCSVIIFLHYNIDLMNSANLVFSDFESISDNTKKGLSLVM